ncbi:MAG: hypothetical protein ABFR53_06910 [Actinomycetota bacterium]
MSDRDSDIPGDDKRSEYVEIPGVSGDDERSEQVEDPGWPWSFILLVVAGALYLIFRFVDLAIKVLT